MYDVQGVRVDPVTRTVWREGEQVRLSRKEFDLLQALISRPGEVVSRDALMREVWHTTFFTSSKTIDVHLGWLRRKIGDDPRRPHLITTLRGRGLRFEPTPPTVTGTPGAPTGEGVSTTTPGGGGGTPGRADALGVGGAIAPTVAAGPEEA